MADYLNGLPHLDGLPAFVFLLHGTYRWDTGTVVRKVLTRKGARDVGCFYSYGPDIWSGYLKEGYLFSPGHPTGEELARAEAFGRDVAVCAGTDECVCPDEDRAAPLLYRLQRFVTNRWLARNVYSRLFRVDRERCTGCGICMELCPTRNIGRADGGRPVWGRDCLLCLTCEMKCPEECIVSPASWPIFSPIMRYNARLAAGDPRIDHVHLDKKQWPRLARGEVDYREITADI